MRDNRIDAVCRRFPKIAVAYDPDGDWSFVPNENEGIPIPVREEGIWHMSRACAAVSVVNGDVTIEIHYNHPSHFTKYALTSNCTKEGVERIMNGLFLNSSTACANYLHSIRLVKNDHLKLVQNGDYDDDAVCALLAYHLGEVSRFVYSDFRC